MPRSWRILMLSLPLLAVLPLAAAPEPPEPQRYARLKREARAFLALPPERRERMRKLDEQLQRVADPARRKHLLDVLERYADWLDRLPADERRQVTEAPTRRARLARIRELRAEQWLRRQPQAVRDRLEGLRGTRDALEAVYAGRLAVRGPAAQAGLAVVAALLEPGQDPRSLAIAGLRKEERRRHRDWQVALRRWDELGPLPLRPVRVSELAPAVKTYVEEYLLPVLSPEERESLAHAEGHFQFLNVLVELADAHPPALPGPRGPTSFKELPQELRKRLWKTVPFKGMGKGLKSPLQKQFKPSQGKWPDYAIAVTRYAADKDVRMPHELWAYSRLDLSPGMQKFLEGRLKPKLEPEEKKLLKASEGKWPEFPRAIEELARRHKLTVPWQTLPGARGQWDLFRTRPKAGGPGPKR
jgi:hypothetical protein